jgi:hypothetical protein
MSETKGTKEPAQRQSDGPRADAEWARLFDEPAELRWIEFDDK